MPSIRTNRSSGEVISASDLNGISQALNTIFTGSEFSPAVKDVVGALVAAAGGTYNATTKTITLPGAAIADGATAGTTTWSSTKIQNQINALLVAGIFTEAVQDVIGVMVQAAGGTYDDAAGTITLPSGGGAAAAPNGVVHVSTSSAALGFIDKTAIANAVAACPVGGTVWLDSLDSVKYQWVGEYVHTKKVNLAGPGIVTSPICIGDGTARNDIGITLQLNMRRELDLTTYPGSTTAPQGYAAGSYLLALDRVRDVKVLPGSSFYGAEKAIWVKPNSAAASHDNSMIHVNGSRFDAVDYAFYADFFGTATDAWQYLADSDFKDNLVNRCYVSMYYAKGIDGGLIGRNTCFMLNYGNTGAQSKRKRQNIRIDWVDWIEIMDNQLFEAGYEAILLDHCRHAKITGNHLAWPGQIVASDAVKVISNSGGAYGSNAYASLVFAHNTASYYSRSVLSCVGDFSGISAGPDIMEYKRDSGRYVGITETTDAQRYATLDAIDHRRYELSAVTNLAASRLVIVGDALAARDPVTGAYLYEDLLPLHPLTTKIFTIAPFSAVTGAIIPSLTFVAATAQSVIQLRGVENASSTWGGQVVVTVMNPVGGANKLATYVLHVAKTTAATGNLTLINVSSGGYTAGAAADDPSFTWTLESNGLRATPVGSTVGAFMFSFASSGNLIVG